MEDWEDPLSPLPPEVGSQGQQDGPWEADPESLGSSRRDGGRVFHFHFSLFNIGHCLQVFP